MYCHKCGNELDEQSKFCPACGTKRLKQEETSAISENIQESFKETNQSAAKEPSETPVSKSKKPLYLVIGGGIFAVILIVTLIFTLGGKDKDEAAGSTAATTNTANGDVDYFQYFDLSAGQFIRETGLELTFQDGSNLYSGYDGKVELSNGEEGIDYFKMATAIGKGSILGVSVGMSKEEAATALQKNGLYEVKTENNHTTYKEQNCSYTLDVGVSVNDSKVNSITYALENADDGESSDKDQTETADNTQDTGNTTIDNGTYNYYYYNVPYAPERSYKYSSNDGYLWPTDRYYISTSDLANYTRDEVAAIRNEIYARHGYVFKTDQWSSYFNARSWYSPNYNYSESMLSSVEKSNINTIVDYEKSMGWK